MKKIAKIAQFLLVASFLSVTVSAGAAFAADRYWVGNDAGCTANTWSDLDCWSSVESGGAGGASVPGSGDVAYFDNGGNTNVTLDADVNVDGFRMASTYSSTITGTTGFDFTVGNSGYTQEGGDFDASNTDIVDMNGNMTVSSGDFDAPSGNMNVARNMTFSSAAEGAFIHNSGSIIFDGGYQTELRANNSITFNNVTINKAGTLSGWDDLDLYNGDTINVAGVLVLTDGQINGNNGGETVVSISTGSVQNWGTAFSGGTAVLTIENEADFQLPANAILPAINIKDSDLEITTAGSVSTSWPFTLTDGSFKNTGNGNLTFNSTFVQETGTVFDMSNSSQTNPSNTVAFASTVNLNGGDFNGQDTETVTFANLFTNAGATVDFSDTDSVTFNHNLDMTSGTFGAPSAELHVKRFMNISGALDTAYIHNNGTIFFDGPVQTELRVNSYVNFYDVIINKPSATSGYDDLDIYSGDKINVLNVLTLIDGQINGDGEVISTSTGSVAGFNLLADEGWKPAFSGGSGLLKIENDVDVVLPSGANLPKLTIDNPDLDITTLGDVTATSVFTLADGSFKNTGNGNLTFNSTFVQEFGTVFDASNVAQTDPSNTVAFVGAVNLNGGNFNGQDTDTMSFSATFTNAGATVDLSDTDLADFNFDFVMTSGTFVAPSANMTESRFMDISAAPNNAFVHNGGTITFDGGNQTELRLNTEVTFNNVIVNKPAAIGGWDDLDLFAGDSMIIEGDFRVIDGEVVAVGAYSIQLNGNWTMETPGSFTYATSTVTLNGGDQKISGDTTFYNLEKPANSTLTFETGSTTTVLNDLTLTGTSAGDRLNLVSDTPGSEWYLNSSGTEDIQYVSVQDSNSTNLIMLDPTDDYIGTGNTGWDILPIILNVGYDSTEGSFEYGDDLTVSPISTGSTYGVNWYKGSSNLSVVNYPFDGSNGDEAITTPDIAGGYYGATLVNSPTWNLNGDRNGYGSYNFNGSNQYLDAGGAFNPTSAQQVTISAWAKPTGITASNGINVGYVAIKGADNLANSYGLLHYSPTGDPEDGWWNFMAYGSNYADANTGVSGGVTTGAWHHLVGVIEGNEIRLYVNGVHVATDTTVGTVNNSANNFRIGAQNNGSYTYYFQGDLDDVQLWDKVLSDEEIASLYANGNSEMDTSEVFPTNSWYPCVIPFDTSSGIYGTYGSEVCGGAETITWDGVEAQTLTSDSGYFVDDDDLTADYSINVGTHGIVNWIKNSDAWAVLNMPFDGENGDEGTQATDFSDHNNDGIFNDNDGVVNGATWLSKGGHDARGAYSFFDNDYIDISSPAGLPLGTADRTVCAWAKTDNIDSGIYSIFVYGSLNTGQAFSIIRNNGSALWFGGYAADIEVPGFFSVDTWYHICATYDGTTVELFGNGSPLTSEARSLNTIDSENARIGDTLDGIGGWEGDIDDVLVFDSVLTDEQIASMYTNGLDVVVAEETSFGDNWKAEVFAFDNSTSGAQSPGEETGAEDIDAVAPVISNLGPASYVDGSSGVDNTPTLTFDIDDPANENVNYQIVIDDSADFLSPVVDYTAGYVAEGSLSFTVGQAAGGGTYATGNQGQTLVDASYYWQVRSTNQTSGLTSSYSVANGGSVAFVLGGPAPGIVTQVSPVGGPGLSDSTPLFVWQDIADEDTYTIDIKLASDLDYSSPVLTMTGIPQDSTSYEATSALSIGQSYEWRIYGVSGAGSDPASATSASFNLLNLVPEFPDYLLTGLMFVSFVFVWIKRRELGLLA